MTVPLTFSPEVAEARAAGHAIVALESTIITHGMPYPQNLETARAVEAAVRDAGAVPATIAVLGGVLHAGLEAGRLDALAQATGVAKLSRADLAVCLAAGGTGATTVAATMIAARAAGIEVFATGGIGGVHRGAEISFDISADLHELAETPVTVVAAGDSYNDTAMLAEAHRGILFHPPEKVVREFPQFPVTWNYDELRHEIDQAFLKLQPLR